MNHQKTNRIDGIFSIFSMFIFILLSSSCGPRTVVQDPKNVSLTNSYPNAFLWKKVKKDPAVFQPKELPMGYATKKNGEWVVDPKTQASFFIPYRTSGGLSSAVWRKEADKAVNSLDKAGPRRLEDIPIAERIAMAIFIIPIKILLAGPSSGGIDDDDDDWFTDRDCPREERRRRPDREEECPLPDDTPSDDEESGGENPCDKPSDGEEKE